MGLCVVIKGTEIRVLGIWRESDLKKGIVKNIAMTKSQREKYYPTGKLINKFNESTNPKSD